jgi:hypothetical protein
MTAYLSDFGLARTVAAMLLASSSLLLMMPGHGYASGNERPFQLDSRRPEQEAVRVFGSQLNYDHYYRDGSDACPYCGAE